MIPWLSAELPRIETIGLHAPALAFAIGSSLAVVILVSLLPTRVATQVGLHAALQENSRTISGRCRAREWLVMAQMAVAVVLVFTAVLMGHSLVVLQSVSPGFNAQNVLTMHLAVTRQASDGYPGG